MDIVTYALSKKYTEKSLKGVGALKGAPCRVTAIEEVEGGNKITLSWTDIDGKTLSESLIVKNGEQGNGIAKVDKIKTVDLVDTYRMTFDDGSTFDYEITNGDSSDSGKIDIIKVNGTELPIVDKTVDIEIPDYIYIGNTEPTDENIILWVNPNESGSSGGEIPIEYVYIGNVEPTDENIILWINPDEASDLEVAISKAEGNILEKKQDGLYVAEDTTQFSKEEKASLKEIADKFNGINSIQISNGELLIGVNGITYKFTPSGTVI